MVFQAVIGLVRAPGDDHVPRFQRGQADVVIRDVQKEQGVQPRRFPPTVAVRRFRARLVLLEAHQLDMA